VSDFFYTFFGLTAKKLYNTQIRYFNLGITSP